MNLVSARPFAPVRRGDLLAVAAPASPFDPRRFADGLAVLEQMGYRLRVDKGVFARRGYLAGADRHRAEQLNRLLADPQIAAVICARGGYGSQRILDRLDVAAAAANGKALVGFSDITALLWALWLAGGQQAIHGPSVTTLARTGKAGRQALVQALAGRPVPLQAAADAPVRRSGRAVGPLVGGNLTTLCHLVGTAWAPSFAGCIVVLEDTGEAAYRIDRMIVQMVRAGCFHRTAGLALGTFSRCDDPAQVYRLFSQLAKSLDVPLISGLPVGHGDDNLAFVHGAVAVLDADAGRITYDTAALAGGRRR